MDALSILFWNSQGLSNKILEFNNYINSEKVDIICVCETFLKPNMSIPLIPNYNYLRKDRTRCRLGGLLIFYKKNLLVKNVNIPDTSILETLGVEIQVRNQSCYIILVYLPGGTKTKHIKDHYYHDLRLLTSLRKPYFLVGDFNSSHKSWRCLRNNTAGKILFDTCKNSNFFINYPNDHTHIPTNNLNNPSTLDLVITNALINSSLPISLDKFTSNHNPVLFTINTNYPKQNIQIKLNYQKANWMKFRGFIRKYLPTPQYNLNNTTRSKIDSLINNFVETIKKAQIVSIPYETHKNGLVFNAVIKSLISKRNYFRRIWSRHRNPQYKFYYNYYKYLVNKEITKLSNLKWNSRLNECSPQNNNIFKITKQLKNKNNRTIPPLQINNKTLITAEEKAATFGSYFASQHLNNKVNDNPTFTTKIIRNVNKFNKLKKTTQSPFNNIKNVINEIKKIKISKSPGHDEINGKLIKNLPGNAINYLNIIFNCCLKINYFPNTWKQAIIIPVIKPKKDKNLVESYRPISLLCVIGKIFENILYNKLLKFVEEKEILPNFQFGFRREHSATHQLLRIKKHVKQKLQIKNSTGMVLLDVHKAFDQIWTPGLIYKLIKLKVPDYLIKIISSFLENRTFNVRIQDKFSATHNLTYGVPQGSVLSPVLYNLYIYDLPKTKCELALFADDTAIFTSSKLVKPIEKKLSSDINTLNKYYNKWKITINNDKTQAIFFSNRKYKQLPVNPIVTKFGNINFKPEVRYLGVLFNNKLKFNLHIAKQIEKVDNIFKLLYPLLNRRSSLDSKIKINIYKLYLRPILLYASSVFIDSPPSILKAIQIKQNKILKSMLGLPWYTRTSIIHCIANISLIHEQMLKLDLNLKDKTRNSNNPIISSLYN